MFGPSAPREVFGAFYTGGDADVRHTLGWIDALEKGAAVSQRRSDSGVNVFLQDHGQPAAARGPRCRNPGYDRALLIHQNGGATLLHNDEGRAFHGRGDTLSSVKKPGLTKQSALVDGVHEVPRLDLHRAEDGLQRPSHYRDA